MTAENQPPDALPGLQNEKINLQELSGKVSSIFTMPQILAKILQAVNDPQVSAALLEKIFKHDPGFTLKTLTLANSAYYGAPGKVTNMRSAITLLGLNLLKNLAIHASVSSLFHFEPVSPLFSGYELWKHSVGVGTCARMISRRFKLGNTEDYFTLGILHDVGLILECQFYRDRFLSLLLHLQETPGKLIELEKQTFGMIHAELTAMLCQKWSLPASLSLPVEHHHEPLSAPDSARIPACVLYLADLLTAQKHFGFSYSGAGELHPEILQVLGVDPVDVEVLQEDLGEELLEVSLFFD